METGIVIGVFFRDAGHHSVAGEARRVIFKGVVAAMSNSEEGDDFMWVVSDGLH